MRHVNIPIFIPHLGCPNQCVFCNQRTISGVSEFDISVVEDTIEAALSTIDKDDEVEIAFFGGSFTGIDRDLMIRLLEIASKYINENKVCSIRCSTRPDYINEDVLDILGRYGVKHIELGLQSSDDGVLSASKRGHTFEHEYKACKLILERGFGLTGQMMIGLPGSSLETEVQTAKFIIDAGCDSARIYPTVVFKNTELCDMTANKKYHPLSVEDAVFRSAKVYKMFLDANVVVLRIGLCSSENLSNDDTYFAGPNHPAIGELVENEIYYQNIYLAAKKLTLRPCDILCVGVPRASLSKAVGHNKRNKKVLHDILGVRDVKFYERDDLPRYSVTVSAEDWRNKCT
jgi:histone acetyltransferase (RNA polymerase elongator complex component)